MRGTVIPIAWILMACLSTVAVKSQYYSQSRPYDPKALKVTNLHFFLHTIFAGENQTSVIVAQANSSAGPFGFGTLLAIDNLLTTGPQQDSEVIGNAQGLEVIADKTGPTVVMYYDFGFTTGKFNGSSISVFSRNPIMEKEREVPVVGGRGKFRMAKGVAKLNTYFINNASAVIEYNVTVIHYEDDDN